MVDLATALVTLMLLGAYHIYLRVRVRRDPLYTVHAVNVVAREAWVDTVMSGGEPDVLAVQTLRNSVMASSFMASTAILLMIGTLSLIGSADQPASVWHALNLGGSTANEAVAWKLLCLLIDFFVAFFCFSMCVRFYNHVGYMVSISNDRGRGAISPAMVTAYLNRAGLFYLLGTRSFFYSVPLVFWMFGPQFMIASTVALIAALYPLDRAPKVTISSSRDEPARGGRTAPGTAIVTESRGRTGDTG